MEYNNDKNPSGQEANQLAVYKSCPRPPDIVSNILTTLSLLPLSPSSLAEKNYSINFLFVFSSTGYHHTFQSVTDKCVMGNSAWKQE